MRTLSPYLLSDYVLVFRFKPELGVGNVVWDNPDDPEDITFVSITVKIVPRVIKVNGWTSSGIPNIQVDDANDIVSRVCRLCYLVCVYAPIIRELLIERVKGIVQIYYPIYR